MTFYQPQPYNRLDPDGWDVLYLDQAIPLDPIAKGHMVNDLRSFSRVYLLNPIRLIANLLLGLILILKRLIPFEFKAYGLMHRSAAWFLKTWVQPEACYLIVRHLGLGSNVVNFLIDNGPDRTIPKSQLYPQTVADLANNAFLEHDLILYNFVYDYYQAQAHNPDWIAQVQQRGVCFDSIQPVQPQIDFTRRWHQILDLESAIELFKVFYSLCLTTKEFERAVLSLQFDENFGCYVSAITGDYRWNPVISNRHPLAPNSPFSAARALLLHGLTTEYLHRYLELAAAQAQGRQDQAALETLPNAPSAIALDLP
ncbi:DUF6999 family protein [Nodosilinea sp. E11]|uniref:DUF6999 family protein n=1 Tax=Nodosilinea sp. E11 TaxID=3037479 RepID=UPI0029341043|nr:hypothetical protein [Nodosilinea sp. E11]WOD39659.1 hypothetical protein RRF56_25975 [Nodosilinea sp. E11]